jgi:hypothetical protein
VHRKSGFQHALQPISFETWYGADQHFPVDLGDDSL